MQPLTVTINSTISNSLDYNFNKNPRLDSVHPWVIKGGDTVEFYGYHLITDVGTFRVLGDIVRMTIGGYTCDRIPLSENPIKEDKWQDVTCITSKSLKSGLYKAEMINKFGLYGPTEYLDHYSPVSKIIHHVVSAPIIKSASSAVGSFGGSILTLTG